MADSNHQMLQLREDNARLSKGVKDFERMQTTNESLHNAVEDLKRQLAEAKNASNLQRIEVIQIDKEKSSLGSQIS